MPATPESPPSPGPRRRADPLHVALLVTGAVALVASGLAPRDRTV